METVVTHRRLLLAANSRDGCPSETSIECVQFGEVCRRLTARLQQPRNTRGTSPNLSGEVAMLPAIPDAQVTEQQTTHAVGSTQLGVIATKCEEVSCGQALGARNAMARSRCCGAEMRRGIVVALLADRSAEQRVEFGVFQCRKASCCGPCSPTTRCRAAMVAYIGNAGTQQHRFAGVVTSTPEVTVRQCFVARGPRAPEQNCEFLVVR